MGLFKKKTEIRADTGGYDDPALRALLSGGDMTREIALQIPTVASCIDLIACIVASTPIKLYRETDGTTEEIRGDARVALLNDETGDTLTASDFWRAIIRDYYLGKGGYAYIKKVRGKIVGIYYVDETRLSVHENTDPIFKDYTILVDGKQYKPFEFLKILRNSKNGASGEGIVKEHARLFEVAYQTMVFERNLIKKGGNKKGFLKSEKRIEQAAIDKLREAFRSLYSNENTEPFIVLNSGVDFKESSNTAVELQMNENKETNAAEICKIFHISPDAIMGKASDDTLPNIAKLAVIPLMKIIECALNRDFLLEKEKGVFYWAFDTKQLLRGNLKELMEAYGTGVEKKLISVNEARYEIDMPHVDGLDVFSMGLADVIFDATTGKYFTPNTKMITDPEKAMPEGGDMIES